MTLLQLHADVPGTPDDASQVAYLLGIAHNVDVLGLLSQRSAAIAGAEDHIVSGNLELHAALVDDGDTVVVDFCQLGLQMDTHLVGLEEVTKEAGVGKANNVPVYLETGVKRISEEVVVAADKEGKRITIPSDSVILSVGYKSAPVAPKAKNIHIIGDANKVGNLRTVIWGAWDVAMKL